MKIRTLLVSAALIAATTAPTATAQSTGSTSRTRKAPPPIATARSKTAYSRQKARRYLPPPPPPPAVSTRFSSRSASRGSSPYGSFVTDPSGRIDKSGRPIGFYPVTRSDKATGTQASAIRQDGAAKPRQNPQQDPYKNPSL